MSQSSALALTYQRQRADKAGSVADVGRLQNLIHRHLVFIKTVADVLFDGAREEARLLLHQRHLLSDVLQAKLLEVFSVDFLG